MSEPGLKKFLTDQEQAVQLARETPEGADSIKVDAINVALSLAYSNAIGGNCVITIAELLKAADEAEKWLRGTTNG